MAISFNSEIFFNLKNKSKLKYWLKQVIENQGYKLGNISYIFCSDERILEINKQYLSHDFYTDIITFDYVEKEKISGDIFISIDRVKENALNYEEDFQHELLRVMAHGVLHLLGFEDNSEEEKKLMRQRENEAIDLHYTLYSNE